VVGGAGRADDAWAGMRGDEALVAAPCPSEAGVLDRKSARRVEAARAGRFDVFGDRPTRLAVPIDWSTDPLGARRYRQNLHKLRFLEPLLWSYAASGADEDLALAARIALDWAGQNPYRRPGPAEAWQDKVVGDRVPYLSYLLRAAACEDLLSVAERATLLRSVADHGLALASRQRFVPDNHGLFVDLGLLRLIGFLPFLDRADEWRTLARERFERTLRGRLSEGVWLEHSSAYQFLAIRAVEGFLAAYGADEEIFGLLEEMRSAAGWFVKPDGEITQFGDSNLEPVPDWALDAATGASGLRAYLGAGFAFVRAAGADGDAGYLAVTAGFHNHTHKHADELSFELYDQGTSVVTDTGLYDKDPGPVRDFVVSNRAHSVLTVDAADFPLSTPGSVYGSGLVAAGEGDGWYAIEGRNPLLGPQGVRHRRLFLYAPGAALVIVDRVRADAPHSYARYIHLGPAVELGDGEAPAITAPELDGAIYDLDTGADVTRSQARGQELPPQGLTSPDFRELVPRSTLAYVGTATTETRALTIALDERRLHVEDVVADGDTLEVALVDADGETTTLTVSRSDTTLAVAAG
jgi:hypothetical protein